MSGHLSKRHYLNSQGRPVSAWLMAKTPSLGRPDTVLVRLLGRLGHSKTIGKMRLGTMGRLFSTMRSRIWTKPICVHLSPSVVKLPSHSFVPKPCANVTARSRLVTGDVTGKAQKFSHFPQVVTVSRVKRGVLPPQSSTLDVQCSRPALSVAFGRHR